MIDWLIHGMIYLGSALMIVNIWSFVRFERYVTGRNIRGQNSLMLKAPILLLVLFLAGYLLVGLFGNPDLIIAGILFGGSVFVFIIYHVLNGITRQIMENERQKAELMAAEESSREKNSFLASISHEMRTPMNVILGLDEVALKQPDVPEVTREQLRKIGKSGKHLLSLINNMLDIQDSGTGEIRIRERDFSLREQMEQVSDIAQTLCEEKGLNYRYTISEDAPDALRGDENMFRQAMLDLLENAVKFTDAGGTVSFSVRLAGRDEQACRIECEIADTGIGMDPEFLAKAFEPFTQEDTSYATRYSGSGLGLPAAKNRISAMGGEIRLESERGRGTTATVWIPFQAAENMESAEQGTEIQLAGRRILMAEDVEENAEIVADLLEMEGAETDWAENGRIALEKMRSAPEGWYDAILMDLRMPEMDGLEATEKIRGLDRKDAGTIPIIALTANASEADIRRSMGAGMNALLAKPSDADCLYRVLQEWIGKAEGREGERDEKI